MQTRNNIKTALLLGALFGLLVAVGAFWGWQGMIVAGVLAVLLNLGAWFFSDRIAIASMRGREVSTGDPLYKMVSRLANQAGLPTPRVYICPHQAPNAFATGRDPGHAAVAVTQGALQLLDPDELEGVMAHELAHIRNRDTLISAVAATVAGVFSMLAYSAMWIGPSGHSREHGHPLAKIGMILLGSLGAAVIKATISRSREFVADADGAAIAGNPDGLVSALQKLDDYARRIPMQNPNPAMNNMFIVEPFLGRTLTNLFASHPPTTERVAALVGHQEPQNAETPKRRNAETGVRRTRKAVERA